jgi:phosphohistidine phosphatase
MKRLTLLRHAKSAWDDPVTRDIDRPLNKRGRRAARAIGEAIRAHGLLFDQVMASPALRVVETLRDLQEGYETPLQPHFDDRIYLASPDSLLQLVRAADDRSGALLLVGHSPGLERLALLLTPADGDELRARIEEKYPTGALAEISFKVDHWSEVAEGEGRLERFIRPRDLDPELGPDETN